MKHQPNHDSASIKRKRIETGLTQTELAAKADISPAWMSMIERGVANPSAPVLGRIAKALSCEIVDLLPARAVEGAA